MQTSWKMANQQRTNHLSQYFETKWRYSMSCVLGRTNFFHGFTPNKNQMGFNVRRELPVACHSRDFSQYSKRPLSNFCFLRPKFLGKVSVLFWRRYCACEIAQYVEMSKKSPKMLLASNTASLAFLQIGSPKAYTATWKIVSKMWKVNPRSNVSRMPIPLTLWLSFNRNGENEDIYVNLGW